MDNKAINEFGFRKFQTRWITPSEICIIRVRNCAFLVANATKNSVLATRISLLVAS